MKQAIFKNWNLDQLDKAFGLKQVWKSDLMTAWQNFSVEIDEFEEKTLLNLQIPLIKGGRAWNEVELENKFISPLIMTAKIDNDEISKTEVKNKQNNITDYSNLYLNLSNKVSYPETVVVDSNAKLHNYKIKHILHTTGKSNHKTGENLTYTD